MNRYKVYISFFYAYPCTKPKESSSVEIIYAESDIDALQKSKKIRGELEGFYGKYGEVKILEIWREVT